MKKLVLTLIAIVMIALAPASSQAQEGGAASDFASDARQIETIIEENYAYLERFKDSRPPRSAKLDAMRDAVDTKAELLAYAENVLLSLADHHAITGNSFKHSWAVVPSYADLWIVNDRSRYRIETVRPNSPAAKAGITAGDQLVGIGGVGTTVAVTSQWSELGLSAGEDERNAFAARVLAAGRRDRVRDLTVRGRDGRERRLSLPNLYASDAPARSPLLLSQGPGGARIAIHNSLGDDSTIAAFDAAMAQVPRGRPLEIDLTDTPGGGNTVVARAILGWFVSKPSAYQIHNLPAEMRRTGIARQWVEQVLPRPGKRHKGAVTVRVGRWTGSMGEGLALGFDAIGAKVVGEPMAGLLGAVYDFRLPASGLVLKLPTERLMHVDGAPRETFRPSVP